MTVLLAATLVVMLVMTLVVTGGGAVLHAGEPLQVSALNPELYQPAGTPWPILDLATSALLPGYAFAQVSGSAPPTFDSSELYSDTGVLTIIFSETIDVTPTTNVVPTKIHIRESGSYTGGITLSAGELGTTAADGTAISFTLTASHRATVVGLATPKLTIEPGAVRDTSGNTIEGTFDISTAVFVDYTLIRSWESLPSGMAFSNDGTKMFVVGTSGDDIDEYTLSAAFDVSTLSFVNSTSILNQTSSPSGMAFSNDGLKMFVTGFNNKNINEYALSTAFDASTREFVRAKLVQVQEKNPTGMAFSSDGLKMFVVGTRSDAIHEYTMPAPFDIYRRDFVHTISVATWEGAPQDVAFSNDGLKMFVIGNSKGAMINEYALSTAFDVSTAAHAGSLSVSSEETSPQGMAFSNDGAKMFVVGTSGDDINEYTLNSVYPITVTTTSATTPTLASIQRYNPATQNTNSQTLIYKVTFSENVTGVDVSDFALSSDSTGGTGGGTGISGSGDVYYVTVSVTQDGTYNLDLVSSGHGITDAAANPLINTTPTTGIDQTYTVRIIPPDNTVPTLVSIQRSSPAVENTGSQTLVYEVTFSEDVTGVDASDFALSPGSIGGVGSTNTGSSSGQFMQTRSPALAIPDTDTVSDTITVSNSGTATSVYVAVDITHAHIGDLKIDLIAPDGTTRTLHNYEGGHAKAIDQTYTLSFADVSIAGTWTLRIHDGFNVYHGVLNSWTLTVNYGDAATIPVTGISGSGDVYYVTVSALQDGIYNLDLVSSGHDIADAASNPLTDTDPTGADETYIVSTAVIDDTAPTLESIERYNPASQNTTSQTLIYMATFSENVTGVDASDFILSPDSAGGTGGGSSPVTDVSGSDDVYSVTVFASTNGTYNLDLISSGHGIADTANNPLTNTATTGADQTYTVSITVIDTIYPRLESIERYTPATENTDNQTLVYKATFSENVTGVDASDFILSPDSTWGGNTSASTGQFTHTRSPNLAIPYDVTVSDTITVSSSGTVASVSVEVDITHTYIGDLKIDIIAPDGTSITLHDNSGGSTDNIDQPYAPLFGSIPISGVWTLQIHDNYDADPGVLNSWTLTINYGDTATTVSSVTDISGSGDVYYVTVSALQDGIYNLDLISSGHGIADTASNPLTDTDPTGADQTYIVSITVIDTIYPRLESIERYNPASQNTTSQTLIYMATFSENVTGVDASDFILSPDSAGGTGGGSSPVTDVSGSDDVYSVTVFASTNGTYNLDLISSGHGIADTASNPLTDTDPTGADQTYTVSITVIDTIYPRLESIERYNPASQNTTSQTLIYMATFSENVTGVDASDFILSPDSAGGTGGGSSPVTDVSGSGDVYFVTVFASTNGIYNLDLISSGHGIADTASNPLTDTDPTGADQTYTVSTTVIDTIYPRLESIERYNPASQNTTSQTLIYMATFSENVTGVDASDFILSPDSTWGGNTSASTGQFTHTRSPNLTIPDLATVSDTITVPDSETATSVSVEVDITHNYIGDLKIDIIAPDGTSITLHDNSGGSTDNIDQPYAPLFGSIPISGVWTLQIHDNYDADPGVLNSWTLTINYGDTATTVSSVTDISGSGDVYYVTVSATQDGTYNLDLISSGHGIADTASNPLTDTDPTGADQTYTVSTTVIDTIYPRLESIERYNPASQNTTSQTLIYMATFSENVTGVDASDFILSPDSTWGGNTSASTGQFTHTRSPNLTIPDLATVSDTITVSSSGTVASVSVTVDITHNYIGDLKIDLIAPDGTTRTLHDREGGTANNIYKTYTLPFGSVPISGVWTLQINDNYDVDSGVLNSWTLTIGYGTTLSPVTDVSGSDDVYFVTVFASTNGIYNLDLISSGHGIADTASNPLTDTDPTGADQTYTVSITVIDTIYPRLESIERYNPASQNTTSQTLIYMATFSENVTGVDASDFILSPDSAGGTGGGSSPVTEVSGSDDVYFVTVFASTNGIYNLDLISSGHGIADTASNPLTDTDPTGADQTYTVSITVIDTIYPRLESIERYNPASQNTTSQTLIYMATFSENVTGVDASDFILSPDSAGGGNTSASTGQFTHTRSPNLTIPDLATVSDTITVPDSETATSVSVTVDITHNYIGDLKIDLIAPDGTSITLHDNSGGSTDNIDQPYAPLFGSIPISGVWTLQIHDNYDADPGVLNSWTLTINYGDTATTVSSVTDISGSGDVYYVTVFASTNGIYNLDLISSGHGIADTASNPLTDTDPTGADQTYTVSTTVIDTIYPRLESIERYNPASQNTTSQTLIYMATFSKNVTGVDASDFILSPDSTWGGNTSASTGQFTHTRSPNLTIPDLATVSDTITVSSSGTVASVSVTVDITHNYIGDLKIDLIAPDGTTRTLHDREGGTANNIYKTYTLPFGSVPISGVWTLQINDNYDVDSGVLNSWTLTVNYADAATIPVTGISGSDDVYYVTVFASTNGIYNLDLISSGHGIADTASNPLTDTDPTGADQTYTVSITVIDTIYPRLESIERYNPASQNTTSQTLIYMATFSENVTGVDASDFILSPDSTWGGNTSASTGQFTHTRSPNLTIPDLATVSDTITVSSSGTVASVSVTVDITHNYIGDLKIDLIAPDGTTRTLHDRKGGTANNIYKTYTLPFGSVPISGVWTLQINDNYDVDSGVLNSWTLTIGYGTTLSPVTDVSGSGDVYYVTVSALQDGIYNLDLISSGHGIADTASNPLTDTDPTGADQTYTVS